jgi:hypothetical protein
MIAIEALSAAKRKIGGDILWKEYTDHPDNPSPHLLLNINGLTLNVTFMVGTQKYKLRFADGTKLSPKKRVEQPNYIGSPIFIGCIDRQILTQLTNQLLTA